MLKGKYQLQKRIGRGANGTVYRGTDARGREVAIKQLRASDEEDGRMMIREAHILLGLEHAHIVKLEEMLWDGGDMYLVLELCHCDLHGHMQNLLLAGEKSMAKGQAHLYMGQMLSAMAYCHERRVLHRDIKPSNLLLDETLTRVKVCDFGLSRQFSSKDSSPHTGGVVTLWYRAPEVMLGCRVYGSAVDMWSLGCVWAEMLQLSPLFPSDTEVECLLKVFQLLGTPDEERWPGVSALPYYHAVFPQWSRREDLKVGDAEEQAFLLGFLQLDPSKRVSAAEALKGFPRVG